MHAMVDPHQELIPEWGDVRISLVNESPFDKVARPGDN